MASITHSVSGQLHGEWVRRKFRDTDEGRQAAKAFVASLKGPHTAYDVRTRIDGRVVTKSFNRRKDADNYAATMEADKLRGVVVDPRRAKVTVGEYARAYLDRRHDLAQSTRELYDYLLDKHIVPRLGKTSLASLSPSAVASWHASIAKTQPTMAAKAYRLLAKIMRTAVDEEVLVRTPCRVKGAASETSAERPVATVAEVQALADAMPDDQRIAPLLATWCQLRRGELLGLRRRDIDLKQGLVTVASTRVKTMGGVFITKGPKSEAGKRTVVVPSHVLPDLKRHLKQHVDANPEALVLPLGYRSLRTAWDNARRAVGVDYHLHDLRHTGLTLAAATGATVAELMHRAGHASPMAAMRYQHATRDRDRTLADALAALATPAEVVPIEAAASRARRADADNRGVSGGTGHTR